MEKFFYNLLMKSNIDWNDISSLFRHKTIRPHTTLLYEGDIATNIFFITKGSLRLWHNDNGQDITMQFFFENQFVSSFESFYTEKESLFSIESLEETHLYILSKKNWMTLLKKYPQLNNIFTTILAQKFVDYSNLFLSRITDTPEKRYIDLVRQHSVILKRVPDYYIASYLGITPVSYSRIKKRVKEKKELKINLC